jgi:hypothetical protein
MWCSFIVLCRENILSIFPLQISEGCSVVNNNNNNNNNNKELHEPSKIVPM